MSHTITISEPVFALLDQAAKRKHISPSDLAERLLTEQLSTNQQQSSDKFDDLLHNVHEQMLPYDPSEIEDDITAASQEVKAQRRANRRPV